MVENVQLENDIYLLCLKADSFPEGVHASHRKLTALLKFGDKANHFGISYLYDERILYMAAVEVAKINGRIPAGCEMYTLTKGNYSSVYISDFAKDITRVEEAFKMLLVNPRIDPDGCCAECYLPEGANFSTAKDIRCMVRLAD
jgi:hypothetical protein